MSYVKTLRQLLLLPLLIISLNACDLKDDLLPSDSDERSTVVPGSIGLMPGQIAADFTIKDIYNNDFVLSEHLAGGSDPADIVVLYFTMWCSTCMDDTRHIYNEVMPKFEGRGTVVYALVDYLSGSIPFAYDMASSVNYDPKFTFLADINHTVFNQFNGDMGVTVVIDSDGTILMNEDYRGGITLIEILDQQLPL